MYFAENGDFFFISEIIIDDKKKTIWIEIELCFIYDGLNDNLHRDSELYYVPLIL